MANKCGGCRFAVGASNYHDGGLWCGTQGDFHLAYNFDVCRRGAGGRWMRGRVQMRDTGANHEGIQIRPWPVLPRHDGAVW